MSRRVIFAFVASAAFAACGDGGMGPGEARLRSLGLLQATVVELDIVQDTIELVRHETVQLGITATDENTNPIPDPELEWSITDPTVADFLSDDERTAALLTGLSDTAATIEVVASADGVSDTVVVQLVPLETRLVVLDAEAFTLISTDEERELGTYVFELGGGPAPTIDPGMVVAGAQGGSFLRRVVSVAAPDPLTLETEAAFLSDVYKLGAIAEGTVPFAAGPGGRDVVAEGSGRMMAWGDPAGTTAPAGLFDFEALDLCDDAASPEATAGCTDGAFALTGGTFEANVGLSIALTLLVDPFTDDTSTTFSWLADGTVDVVVDYEAELSPSTEYELARVFPAEGIPFTVLGIPGSIAPTVFTGAHVAGGDALTYITGLEGSQATVLGAAYDGGWMEEASRSGAFEVRSYDFRAGDNGSVRTYAYAGVTVSWAGSTIYASVGPYLSTMIDLSELDHVEHDGVILPAKIHADLNAGIDAVWDVDATFAGDVLTPIDGMAAVDDEDLLEWWGQGEVEIVTTTSGIDLDPDGYTLDVMRALPGEAPVWPAALTSAAPANGVTPFVPPVIGCIQPEGGDPEDCDLVGTRHVADLSGVMWNCTADGGTQLEAHLHPFSRITESFDVTCVSVFEALANTVDELVTAGEITSHGVANALKQRLRNADRQRMRGNPTPAANMLEAFIRHVNAQRTDGFEGPANPQGGKHISPTAATLLIERATQIRDEYLDW